MKKSLSVLLAVFIFVSSSIVGFADTSASCVESVSSVLDKTINEAFDSKNEVIVLGHDEEDITQLFTDECRGYYQNKDIQSVRSFINDNVSSIIIRKTEEENSGFSNVLNPNANKTINVSETQTFTDWDVDCGGLATHLVFQITVRGKYTENPNTGKILSASVTSVKMTYDKPGINWRINPIESYRNAVHSSYSATFIGTMYFTAKYSDGSAVYESPKYMVQFDRYSE